QLTQAEKLSSSIPDLIPSNGKLLEGSEKKNVDSVFITKKSLSSNEDEDVENPDGSNQLDVEMDEIAMKYLKESIETGFKLPLISVEDQKKILETIQTKSNLNDDTTDDMNVDIKKSSSYNRFLSNMKPFDYKL
ncbi:MAG: hypothetical protein MHPSP_002261, partial [Paramarteilia canceri]